MTLRFVQPRDASALREIYGHYIDTAITFETVLPSVDEFASRIAHISSEYPYLVCEEDGRIRGYAYAHRLWERDAYQWSAALSVYLHPDAAGRGLGTTLYRTLEDILKRQHINTVYGLVTMPNAPSERLHLRCGFALHCTFPRAGSKNGGWHDVAWFRKEILPFDAAPAPFLPIGQLPAQELEQLLRTDP